MHPGRVGVPPAGLRVSRSPSADPAPSRRPAHRGSARRRTYPLPAGRGVFPLRSVDDFPATAPASWLQRGGVVLPMDQSEALWISFSARYPCAVKIAAGKINAVSGAAWTAELPSEPQDYVVVPGQPWLDGFSVGEGLIRRFVAMPLGAGYSVEEQLTGLADRADHPAGMSAGIQRARCWNCPGTDPAILTPLPCAVRIIPEAGLRHPVLSTTGLGSAD